MFTTSGRISDIDLAVARGVRTIDALPMLGINHLKREGLELVGPDPRTGQGRDRFQVNSRTGKWICRTENRGGADAISLVMFVLGCSFVEAVRFLAGQSNVRPIRQQLPAPAPRAENDTYTLDLAARIWRETVELPPQAIDYFAKRGIDITVLADHGGLRFDLECPWERENKPCIIGRFTTVIGTEQRGIWRRPVTGEKPKTLGPMAGCVIRLWPDEEVTTGLVLAEGIETALAAATGRTHGGTLLRPAWAAGCAGNMASFPVLPGIESLTLIVDHDGNGAGERAAEQCARRWIKAGREVELLIPNQVGADFNDLIKKAA